VDIFKVSVEGVFGSGNISSQPSKRQLVSIRVLSVRAQGLTNWINKNICFSLWALVG